MGQEKLIVDALCRTEGMTSHSAEAMAENACFWVFSVMPQESPCPQWIQVHLQAFTGQAVLPSQIMGLVAQYCHYTN